MQPKVSRPPDEKSTIVQKVFDTVSSIDEMQSRLGNSPDTQAVLSSPTVEQYFVNSLRVFLRKSDDAKEDHDLFVGVRTFVFLGQTEVTSAYGQMLQEMLSYYNVFETDLMISSLDG